MFFVDDLVEGLDSSAFEDRYDALGERVYPTRMLLKSWLFGAIAGVYSAAGRSRGGLPAELQRRERRREKLAEEKGEKLEDRHQKSFADLEANMMRTGEGAMQYRYNAQAATSEGGIIVATALSASPADAPQLVPIVDAVRKTTGKGPALVLADAGYRSEENSSVMRRRLQRLLVSIGREKKGVKRPRGRCTPAARRKASGGGVTEPLCPLPQPLEPAAIPAGSLDLSSFARLVSPALDTVSCRTTFAPKRRASPASLS